MNFIHIYEKIMEIMKNKVYGDYHENKVVYAELMEKKFMNIDPLIFEKGYFWPGVLEGMYDGV